MPIATKQVLMRCGQCAESWPDTLPPIVATLIREGEWFAWHPWERIGSDLRDQATTANKAARMSNSFDGPIQQPRSNEYPMAEELPATIKIVCRNGHDLRRSRRWIEELMKRAIARGDDHVLLF